MYGHFEIAGSLLGYLYVENHVLYVSTHTHIYIYIHIGLNLGLLLRQKNVQGIWLEVHPIRIGNILYVCAILKYLVFSQ